MITGPKMQPMPRAKRRYTFLLLLLLFVCAIPFLYLYATGYRLDFTERTNLISTGGIFIAAEQKGVQIYIDNALVRETRIFTKAFYAQNIDPGTHRVHVQKDGYHTWVKELPVYPHLVTEVQAFNLPLVPKARLITRFETTTGAPVVSGGTMVLASTTVPVFATIAVATTSFVANSEFADKTTLFGIIAKATSTTQAVRVLNKIEETASGLVHGEATSTKETATTTKEYGGVRLFERGADIFAGWVGSRESMPYYYCAEAFDSLGSTTQKNAKTSNLDSILVKKVDTESLVNPPVQKVPEGAVCVPEIRIDRKWQKVHYFDFFPGSTDLVVVVLDDGVYAVEVDDRSWQNVQPIMIGKGLSARVDNGRVIIFDGTQFYEMLFE